MIEDLKAKLLTLDVTLEGARGQVQDLLKGLSEAGNLPSAAQTAVANVEQLAVGSVTAPSGNEAVKGKRRARCANECGELHWNGHGNSCNKCRAVLPMGAH